MAKLGVRLRTASRRSDMRTCVPPFPIACPRRPSFFVSQIPTPNSPESPTVDSAQAQIATKARVLTLSAQCKLCKVPFSVSWCWRPPRKWDGRKYGLKTRCRLARAARQAAAIHGTGSAAIPLLFPARGPTNQPSASGCTNISSIGQPRRWQ